MIAALVDNTSNIVTDTIVADATVDPAPEGSYLVNIPDGVVVNIGDPYDPVNQVFPNLAAAQTTQTAQTVDQPTPTVDQPAQTVDQTTTTSTDQTVPAGN